MKRNRALCVNYSKTKFFLLPIFFMLIQSENILSQTTWEFSGTPYSYQKTHFDSATNIIKAKLGLQMRTFGAPYNQIDATFISVFASDTNYKVLLFGQLNPVGPGQINLTNRVFIESATGVPDYNYFLSSYYSKKGIYIDYMVMQGHPYAWTTPAKLAEFQNIVNFLISTDSVVFNTPYGYFKYLNDLSIPRTNKIQVILKLDDLRATSYFNPCLPTFDFLSVNKVKAGFGVNQMGALTQAQIDTLNYYLSQTTVSGDNLFEIWNHGLDHSMTAATTGGNWSSPSAWPSGYVPTSADDVEIPNGVTVTIDVTNAVCGDLTVNGTLVTLNTTATSLTVNGDLLINSGGSFTSPSLTGGTANIFHSLSVYGNFTNTGGIFDFRQGSAGTTLRAINTTFLGNYNSTITVGTYSSTNNDFNSITINKSNGAKVICASDVVVDPGSSTGLSQLIFVNGMVETGNNAIYALSTTTAHVVNASTTSYVNGALARGMSNSAGKSCPFQIGDANGYRPITVRSTTAGTATGHYVLVRCVSADANTGSSTFTGGIQNVSAVRYFKISYHKGIGTGASSMSFDLFSPSYGADDGVIEGNNNLRVAYSTNERATWNGMAQTTSHFISLTSPPTTFIPTALSTPVTLNSGSGYIYTALATNDGIPLPIELTSFSVSSNNNNIILKWSTETEVSSSSFEIEKKKIDTEKWQTVASVKASGNSNSLKHYCFIDQKLNSGRYLYRLKMIDNDGEFKYSDVVEAEIGFPKDFKVSQNYPNPFNPTTCIDYQIPFDSKVTLELYGISGEKVGTIINKELSAGYYIAEINANELNLSSGVYIYRMTVISKAGQNFIGAKKMMLMK